MYIHAPEAAHFLLGKSDCLGCAVLLCLVVCLTVLTSFSSLIKTCSSIVLSRIVHTVMLSVYGPSRSQRGTHHSSIVLSRIVHTIMLSVYGLSHSQRGTHRSTAVLLLPANGNPRFSEEDQLVLVSMATILKIAAQF